MERHPFAVLMGLRLLAARRALVATAHLGRLAQPCRQQLARLVAPYCGPLRRRAVAQEFATQNSLVLLARRLFCLRQTASRRSLVFSVVLALAQVFGPVLVFVQAQVLLRSDLLAAYYILVLYLLFKH